MVWPEWAGDVVFPSGETKSVSQLRADAADQFNAGLVRFLVSTEAGGEGIDLQESCHSLIHVDLPWNPMRMHQRVGRLNRYGQKMWGGYLGTRISYGCIILKDADAAALFNWAEIGTPVWIHY